MKKLLLFMSLLFGALLMSAQTANTVITNELDVNNQKQPIVDIVLESPNEINTGFAGTYRFFIKQEGNDTLRYVANVSFGAADSVSGKIWFSTYWGETGKWYTSTFEKGFWWTEGGIILKPGIPDVYHEGLIYRRPDGTLMTVEDNIPSILLTDKALERLIISVGD